MARKCAKHIIPGPLLEVEMSKKPFLEVEMSKKCTPLWREAHFQVKMLKTPLLEVEMSKKCTPLWREAHCQVKKLKTQHARTTFEGSDVVLRGRRKGFCTLPKVSKKNAKVLEQFQLQ